MCNPSSLEINSLLKHNPGSIPLFFNQNIEQNAPLKNNPSTIENAINLCPKVESCSIHFIAQSAFNFTAGIVSILFNNCVFLSLSLIYVSINNE